LIGLREQNIMTALDRLRETIDFVSPQKKFFTAYWGENERNISKSLGVFKYPGIKGARVQDLDAGPVAYPLNFFFQGENHDRQAEAFFSACLENGLWEITHPVFDALTLQLSSVSQLASGTNEINISRFKTEWIDPTPIGEIVSVQEASERLLIQAELANESSAGQFERFVSLENASVRSSVVTGSRSLLDSIRSAMSALYELNAQINAYINSVQRAIDNALNEVVLKPLALARQFQQLIQLPIQATDNIESKLSATSDLIESIFELTPNTPFPESRNTASLIDLAVTASLNAAAQSVINADLTTRREALDAANLISNLFTDNVDRLDEIQKTFEGQIAARQYFSQSESFQDITLSVLLAIDLAIRTSFDLKIEKKIILERHRAPIMIALEEYGGPGDNDANIDFFITSNKLAGDEIFLLPSGKEVVVYV
jgi:hypothetical protein